MPNTPMFFLRFSLSISFIWKIPKAYEYEKHTITVLCLFQSSKMSYISKFVRFYYRKKHSILTRCFCSPIIDGQ
jgi:hypothetical protein